MTRDKKTEKKTLMATVDKSGAEKSRSAEKTAKRLRRGLRRGLNDLSEAEAQILTLWTEGDSLSAIAEKTCIPLETTRRKLKRLQRKLVENLFEEMDEIVGRVQHEQVEFDRLREETRSNISELRRIIAA